MRLHFREDTMARTAAPGITSDTDGRILIDRVHCGTRIDLRLGHGTAEVAERRLLPEMAQAEADLVRRKPYRPLFGDCAALYLAQRSTSRSLSTMDIHVRMLCPPSATCCRSRCTTRR